MPTYVVHNTHSPDDCPALNEEIQQSPWSAALKGQVFLCTCPGGVHQGLFHVEAASPDEALSLVGPRFRAGARAIEAFVGVLGEHELLPLR
jgi:hypothetical protein